MYLGAKAFLTQVTESLLIPSLFLEDSLLTIGNMR